MRRLVLLGLLLAGPAMADPPPQLDYRTQAAGAELLACVGGKVSVSAELLAARARIADLEKQLSAKSDKP